MEDEELFEAIRGAALQQQGTMDWEVLRRLLIPHLNELLVSDFHRVLVLLYRIDVSEKVVREALEKHVHEKTGGEILADLIIARQQQKVELRKKYSKKG